MSKNETTRRAELVTALREVADLLEADTSLPVPYSATLQAGLLSAIVMDDGTVRHTTQAERFALVRRAAIKLGVDVLEGGDRSRRAEYRLGPVLFKVYAEPDSQPVSKPQERVVSADEDAALIGGVR